MTSPHRNKSKHIRWILLLLVSTMPAGETVSGKELFTLKHEGKVRCLAISPDGKRLAAAIVKMDGDRLGQAEVVIWDLAQKKELRRLPGQCQELNSVVFSPDGKLLATNAVRDGCGLVVIELSNGETTMEVKTQETVTSLAFSPDGKALAAGLIHSSVRVWEVATKNELHQGRFHDEDSNAPTHVAYSPNGQRLVAGSWLVSPTVKIWDTRNWTDTTLEAGIVNGVRHGIEALHFFPDSKRLAVSATGRFVVWNIDQKKSVGGATGNEGNFESSALSRDGTLLAMAARAAGRRVTIWRAASAVLLHEFPSKEPCHALAFAPDNKRLAGGFDDGTVRIWDVGVKR